MNRFAIFLCILFAVSCLARNPKDRYGILYVNEIIANSDTHKVQIEENFIEDNVLTLDVMNEWTGEGIIGEGIHFKDGIATLTDDFLVNPPTTFVGALYAHGGVFGDAGTFTTQNDFSSFILEDDSGRTTVRGELFVKRHVDVDNGAFTIVGESGETEIRSALLHANGGINVNGGRFTVDKEGGVFGISDIQVSKNIFLGTSASESRYVKRLPTFDRQGGKTYVKSQDATANGGDLILVPGKGTLLPGRIIFGEDTGHNLNITRPFSINLRANQSDPFFVDGGDTFYLGQNTEEGDGGALIFNAGDSYTNGMGGNLILAPGLSADDDDVHGRILFGTPVQGDADFDLIIGRPTLKVGTAGDTFFEGQHTQNGDAGDIILRAGHVALNGTGAGGDVYIIPGLNYANFEQGSIFIGNPASTNLTLTRFRIASIGGDTTYLGQDSTNGEGGDLYFRAGKALTAGNGGSIHLVPGTIPLDNVQVGQIYFGQSADDIELTRLPTTGGGQDTFIIGQEGMAALGGDLHLIAGEGLTGGDLIAAGGPGFPFAGGNVQITGGEGNYNGGNVVFRAGSSIISTSGTDGGNIVISAGDGSANAGNGGDVTFNAGTGVENGDVIIGPNAGAININEMPIIIEDSYLQFQTGEQEIIFKADPISLITYKGRTILRTLSDITVPYVPEHDILGAYRFRGGAGVVQQLQTTYQAIIHALGQCQHGLLEVREFDGSLAYCPEL